ncbi:MAG: hypothetical protein GC189_11570 [Alphaproteobacteria bacterium]|nr:hypothetical protein [Alphaproteobacteria bacterium]
MSGLLAATRLIGALFAQVFLGVALLAALGPVELSRHVPHLRVGAAAAATAQPSATRAHGGLSADIIVFAPKAMGAEVLDIAARATIDRSEPWMGDAMFARVRSGIALEGEAGLWWAQADGRYARSIYPDIGGVLVLTGAVGPHVAVVAGVLNQREVLIDHADWNGAGAIVRGALVRDVSGAGDWSAVRVWDADAGALGARVYDAQGFIHPARLSS